MTRCPEIIAHRCNTLADLDRMARIGCPAVEIDVHVNSLGVPVVVHDEDERDEPEHTHLDAFLDACTALGLSVLLDLKSFSEEVLVVLREHLPADLTIGIASFNPHILGLAWRFPGKRMLILREFTVPLFDGVVADAREANLLVMHRLYQDCTHKNGMLAGCFTVNDPKTARVAFGNGFDFLITDEPEVLLSTPR